MGVHMHEIHSPQGIIIWVFGQDNSVLKRTEKLSPPQVNISQNGLRGRNSTQSYKQRGHILTFAPQA